MFLLASSLYSSLSLDAHLSIVLTGGSSLHYLLLPLCTLTALWGGEHRANERTLRCQTSLNSSEACPPPVTQELPPCSSSTYKTHTSVREVSSRLGGLQYYLGSSHPLVSGAPNPAHWHCRQGTPVPWPSSNLHPFSFLGLHQLVGEQPQSGELRGSCLCRWNNCHPLNMRTYKCLNIHGSRVRDRYVPDTTPGDWQ